MRLRTMSAPCPAKCANSSKLGHSKAVNVTKRVTKSPTVATTEAEMGIAKLVDFASFGEQESLRRGSGAQRRVAAACAANKAVS